MKLNLLKLAEIFWLAEAAVGVDPDWGSEIPDVVPVVAVGDSVRVGGGVNWAGGPSFVTPTCLISPVDGGFSVLCESDGSTSPVFSEVREAVAWSYVVGL